MKRTAIPLAVKATLRREVGFGCPVKGCGNPYLEYHHFDPPVSVQAHNNPEGMIALCIEHHKKADGGAYTIEHLHQLKKDRANADLVKGDLSWLRRDLLAMVGGCFYYKVPRILIVDGVDVVTLHKDDEGYLRLSVNMLSLSPEQRIVIDKNEWGSVGAPVELRSPPQGKELEVRYANGDYLYLRFFVLDDVAAAAKRFPDQRWVTWDGIEYPLTVVEVNFRADGANVDLTPDGSKFNTNVIRGGFVSNAGGGISIGTGNKWRQNPVDI